MTVHHLVIYICSPTSYTKFFNDWVSFVTYVSWTCFGLHRSIFRSGLQAVFADLVCGNKRTTRHTQPLLSNGWMCRVVGWLTWGVKFVDDMLWTDVWTSYGTVLSLESQASRDIAPCRNISFLHSAHLIILEIWTSQKKGLSYAVVTDIISWAISCRNKIYCSKMSILRILCMSEQALKSSISHHPLLKIDTYIS